MYMRGFDAPLSNRTARSRRSAISDHRWRERESSQTIFPGRSSDSRPSVHLAVRWTLFPRANSGRQADRPIALTQHHRRSALWIASANCNGESSGPSWATDSNLANSHLNRGGSGPLRFQLCAKVAKTPRPPRGKKNGSDQNSFIAGRSLRPIRN